MLAQKELFKCIKTIRGVLYKMKTINDYKDEFEQIKDESKNKLEDFNELLQQVIVARENALEGSRGYKTYVVSL